MKPIDLDLKKGFIIGFVALLVSLFGLVKEGEEFIEFIAPGNEWLNWRFFIAIIVLSGLIVGVIMNQLWMRDYKKLKETIYDRDNYKARLKIRENERLVDVITGVPNSISLEYDINEYLEEKRQNKQLQFILIDLKDFGKINNKFGFIKTNELLRTVAQTIYQKMRRNEEMYKYLMDDNSRKKEKFYRLHTGGDEFVFIVEGNQSDAIGFSNRLVKSFEAINSKTKSILGVEVKLSFHCAIIEIDPRDKLSDLLRKTHDCYNLAKEGKKDFNIAWHPNNLERLAKQGWQKANYENARKIFDVMTIEDKEYRVE